MIRSAQASRIDRFAASPVCGAALVPLAWFVSLVSVGFATAADAPRKLASAPASSAVATRKTFVDPAVTPAGGGCRDCGPGGCHHGHRGHGHHAGCREGHCVPYCPVRPDRFGFYDTQWRKWPGQGVVPASASELATPAVPPKSALPGVDEESFGPPSADGAEPAARGVNSADRPDSPRGKAPQPVPSVPAPVPQEPEAAEPVVPTPQPAPSVVPEPEATAPAPEPVPELPPAFPGIESPATDLPATDSPATDSPAETPPLPPVPEAPATPQPAPAAPEKSNDGDLFDEAAVGRARRVFIASRGGEGREAASAGVQQAIHRRGVARLQVEGRTTTATGNVPRVSFDPRAEAEQLRAGR